MANITTQTIRVDLSTDKVLPTAFTHQNDTARTLEFSMYNKGIPYTMTGNTVKFAYKSPIVNGQYSVIAGASMASGTVSGNKVTVTLPVAYTQISGVGMLTMIITPTSGTVRPVNIRLVVQKSADGANEIAGASDFPATLDEIAANWLDENISIQIDDTLSVSGKAADAKVTGDEISELDGQIGGLKSDLLELQNGGYVADAQRIGEVVDSWLDDHPEATTTVQDGSLTFQKLNSKLANATYTLAQFDGDTNEDKLFNALDNVVFGVIQCGEIEINNQYTPSNAKDYRNITILGATITLTVDGWFKQGYSQWHTVPKFESCNIDGKHHKFYDSSGTNVVGAYFRNCSLRRVCIYNNTTNGYLQSPYFIGCSMNPVENLFSVYALIDFRMMGCRVESATDPLCVVTGPNGVVSGSVIGTLIEGRHDVVFSISACYKFEIKDCYFEENLNGLLNQTTSGIANITVEDCTFLKPIDVECAINITSGNYQYCVIQNNLCNYDSGHYICNKKPNHQVSLNQVNTNYLHDWGKSFGFKPGPDINTIGYIKTAGTWDSDNSTWNFQIKNGYATAYESIHPFYVVFTGSFNTTAYQGYAIIRVCPRIAYNSSTSALEIVCETEIIDSCNSSSMTKTSTVDVDVDVNNKSYTNTSVIYTVKVSGFSSHRGEFRVVDPFSIVEREYI